MGNGTQRALDEACGDLMSQTHQIASEPNL